MSELLQIKDHDISLENSDMWAEKAKGKKLVLIDLANCEDMTIKKSKTVGDIEKEFAKIMGIGIQIMLPDGSGFANNSVRLKDVAKAV